MAIYSIVANHLLVFEKFIIKLLVLTLLFSVPIAKSAYANTCPVSADYALWLQIACDVAESEAEILDKVNGINANFGNATVNFRHTIAVMSLAEAAAFDPKAPRKEWMFQSTSLFTVGEQRGILRPYLPRTKEEDAAEASLIHALAQPGKPELSQIIAFVQLIVENRGGKLLMGMDDTGTLYPFVTSALTHCRWADVRLTEFDILGSFDRLSTDGKAVGVTWADGPRACSEVEN